MEKKYYYYKKKVGRHKKPGAKKKKRQRGRRWQEPWDYKILRFDFRKQVGYIGQYHDLSEVEMVKRILNRKNEEIVFPKKYSNNCRASRKIYDFLSEYVVLKRVKGNANEEGSGMLRNEYGKFVEHKYTDKDWVIVDKMPCVVEETFWVYGFNPKTDRKTFSWIYENFIDQQIYDKNSIIIIYIYGNKVIFKYDLDFEFVICKNQSDAIRMYNLLEEWCSKNKKKSAIFSGMINGRTQRLEQTIEMIRDKTGWDRRKITRRTTRA